MPRESRQYRKRSRSDSSNSSDNERTRRRRSRSKDKREKPRAYSREVSKTARSTERGRKSRSRSRERRKRARSRSRSRERPRDRRRSKSRSREKDKYKRRRSRTRSPKRNSRRSRSKEKFSRSRDESKYDDKSHIKQDKDYRTKDDKSESKEDVNKTLQLEQKKLEEEMQKRRDRIERWRQERKKAAEVIAASTQAQETEEQVSQKKWSLEDDEEDDEEEEEQPEETTETAKEEDKVKGDEEVDDKGEDADDEKEEEETDGVDPLEAFMKGVQEEVQKIKATDRERMGLGGGIVKTQAPPQNGNQEVSKGKLSIVTGVAKKKAEPEPIESKETTQKGELMENDQDAMEWSSDDHQEGNLMDAVAALEQKKKKELTVVDHSTMTYKSFRKNFYVEVPELAKLTDEEVEKRRSDMEGIKIRGKDCPKPVEDWVQCGVSQKVLAVLKKNKYEKPTPIQSQAMSAIMSGRDLIGIAKTGSGKTLAFLIPMFRHIMDQDPLEAEDGPICVIMAPTRELAMQIYKECRKFSKSLGLQSVCVYGGTGISEQIAELKKGAEIIVCTPGRMIDMLAANNGRVTNLKRCTYLVLDEADRMFDMGFEPQVMRIVENVRPDRQTVLFSATFPRQMEALARKILTKPIEVQVGGRSVVCSDVLQHAIIVEEEQKFLKLLELLGMYSEQGSALLFVERQESADLLLRDLLKASYPCLALHGGIDQYDRDSIIQDFKQGNITILVATSVAARGLDVKQLILVVNYDCPNHYEDYVHRVGRTGRAGNKGYSYTFLTSDQQRYAGDVIKAFELSEQKPPDELIKMWTTFTEQQKADGKKVYNNSGFSGKGFRFDETEKELANAKKKLQKAALGLQDSDSDDGGLDIDEQIESMFASKKRVKDVTEDELPTKMNQQGISADGNVLFGLPQNINKANLELAKRLASRINQSLESGRQTNVVQQATQALMQGGSIGQNPISKMTIAEQIAGKLNAKLNYIPKSALEDDDGKEEPKKATFRKYEEELEINDFPQTARWKVTSKENLANIQEYSDAGVTIRGTHFPQGKEPKEEEGERKLYLSIESTSELSVQKAKAEITRLIKDELIRLQNSYQPTNKGRYKVL